MMNLLQSAKTWMKRSNRIAADRRAKARRLESLEPRYVMDSTVVFNEVMYHTSDDPTQEWFELFNQSAVDMDVSGWKISGGVDYTFPADTILSGGEYIVVAADPATLALSANGARIVGPFVNRLSNSGDTLRLSNQNDRLMDELEYDDDDDWPVGPDGSGASLAKADPFTFTGDFANWRASAQIGGTPGAENFSKEEFFDRGRLALLIDPVDGQTTMYNPSSKPVTIVGYSIGSPDGSLLPGNGDWLSLDDANVGGAGAWLEANVSVNFLNELSPTESLTIEPGQTISLGQAFDPDATRDLFFEYLRDGVGLADVGEVGYGVALSGALKLQVNAATGAASLVNTSLFPIEMTGYSILSAGGGLLQGAGAWASLQDQQIGGPGVWFEANPNASQLSELNPIGSTVIAPGESLPLGFPYNVAAAAHDLTLEFSVKGDTAALGTVAYGSLAGEAPPEVGLRLNEIESATAATFWVELTNVDDEPINLAGYVIANGDASIEYVIPSGTLAPGAFVVFNQSQLGFGASDEDKLFVYQPDKTAVTDAASVKNRLRGRLPDGFGILQTPDVATPGAANSFDIDDNIVINEIQYNHRPNYATPEGAPFSESAEEWIELYNRSATETVDLTGWRIAGGIDFDFPADTLLAPGEFLVVALDPGALEALHPAVFQLGDVLGPFTGRLSNEGDRIQLVDANRNTVDEVRYYDDGRFPAAADGGGSSLELRDPLADNNRAEAWAASDEALALGRSTWNSYSYTRTVAPQVFDPAINFHEFVMGLLDAGELLIDNLRVVDVTGGGSVDLLQNGDFEADAIGASPAAWRNIGTHNSSRVIADPLDPLNNALHLIAVAPADYISNHSETTLALGAQVVNGRTYQISFDAMWISGSPQLHTELYYQDAARTTIIAQPTQSGTPGAANSTLEANIGPTYDDFAHGPIVPESSQTVVVSARIDDPQGVAAATLFYSVGGGVFSSLPMSLAAAGEYRGEIPRQPNGSVVQFYVEAVDSLGGVSTYPEAGADSRALYRVVDGFSPDPLRQDFDIILLPDEAGDLHAVTDIMDNDRAGGTIVYRGREAFYDVGVRLRGSMFTRNNVTTTGYNVRFSPDHLFRGVHDTVTLDQALEQEILVKHLINQAGVLGGMYDDVVQLRSPTGGGGGPTLLGMARQGDVFLDSQFDDGSDGTLFKFDGIRVLQLNSPDPEALKTYQPIDFVYAFDLADLGDDKELYRWPLMINNSRDRDDYAPIIAAAKAIGADLASLEEAVAAVLDVDQWAQTFAMMSLAGVVDAYSQGGPHNLNLYVRPSDGKVLALPWDWDIAFTLNTGAAVHGNRNLGRVWDVPAYERLFYGHALDVIDTAANAATMNRWIDHYGEMLGLNFSAVSGYLDARSASVTNQILADFPQIAFDVTSPNSVVVADVVATITGVGWVDVKEIRLAGSDEPLAVKWSTSGLSDDASFWQATVPVPFGSQQMTFEAYDYRGQLIGSETITVTSTVSNRPLQDFLRITEFNYHPQTDGDAEYIELSNVSSGENAVTLDLSGVRIVDGPSSPYVFAPGTMLSPGEHILVVRDQIAFANAYPGVDPSLVDGQYSGALDNNSERIRMVDGQGATIADFVYADGNEPGEEGWPPEADGLGFSLVLIDPLGDSSSPLNWRTSGLIGGSPGATDPPIFPGDLDGDGATGRRELVQILKSFGHVATSRATGDLNRDLTTGLADLAIAQRGFAPSPAPSPVASNASRDEDSTILRTNAARRSTSIRPVRRAILHDLALVSIESARPDEAESPRALRSLIRRR